CAGPDHDADHGDHGPQAQHCTPIEQAPDLYPSWPPLRAAAARTPFPLRRRIVIVVLDRAFGGGLFRLALAVRNAVLRTQAQFGERSAEPKLRLLAHTALFPSQRHPPSPAFPLDGQTSGTG